MELSIKSNKTILALGSEFDTRLCIYSKRNIFFSKNIDKLAENPEKLKNFILNFLNSYLPKRKPNIIITDFHPLYNSHKIGERLAEKWHIPHIKVQHHIAHIFSAIGDYLVNYPPDFFKNKNFYGIACDGTGYGLDDNIWGGEVFKFFCNIPFKDYKSTQIKSSHLPVIKRIGHLEEHYLLGGELAVKEPSRSLFSILYKILPKQKVFNFVKKYYSNNQFELLYNQMEQKYNCPITTSTGRVLDAISLLLEFSRNERPYKHYAAKELEDNTCKSPSLKEYLMPKLEKNDNGEYVLNTSYLFKYLVNNISLDKSILAFISQQYIIEGLFKIIHSESKVFLNHPPFIFLSGGLSKNKVMKKFADKNHIYTSRKISCGDEGIALGQIFYYLVSFNDL